MSDQYLEVEHDSAIIKGNATIVDFGLDEDVWVPNSVIDLDALEGEERLVIKEWWIIKKGLEYLCVE